VTKPRDSALASDLHVLIGQLRRRLREQGSVGDLTHSQVTALRHLERAGPATITALARTEGMRSQSMGATIAALESAGLVSGAPDPHDGRQTLWSLTPECRERLRASRAAREDWLLRTIRAKLSSQEQAELAHALELFKRLVG
jgi:DNA-binding MarR family transcriptional regulator